MATAWTSSGHYKLHEYDHQLSSWEFYPRVYYFNNRLKRFIPRFENISEYFGPGSRELIQKLQATRAQFSEPPIVKVIGEHDLREGEFTVAEVEDEHPTCRKLQEASVVKQDNQQVIVVIYHATVDSLDEDSLKFFKSFIDSAVLVGSRATCLISFVVCWTRQDFTKGQETLARHTLEHYLRLNSITKFNPENWTIVVGKRSRNTLPKCISNVFEHKIVKCFQDVRDFSEEQLMSLQSNDIFENTSVREQLVNCLETAHARSVERDKDVTFIEHVINTLARALRCILNTPIARRYNVSLDACNRKMISIKFENKVVRAIPDSLRNELRRLEYGQERASIEQLVNKLKLPIKSVVSETEREVGQSKDIIQRLSLEMDNYLKKSILNEEDKGEKVGKTYRPVDDDTRKEILRQTGVNAVGTIYGNFEVHVDVGKVDEIRNEVEKIFSERNIDVPFAVKVVERQPQPCSDVTYGNGNEVYCTEDKRGTLGAFVDGSDANLYGLTCAHVVMPIIYQKEIYFKDERETVLLGTTAPDLTVYPGRGLKPLIDLAAIRVNENVRQKCVRRLKDEDGIYRKAVIRTSLEDLAGSSVFKHGATTLLTVGEVCSEDYSYLFEEDEIVYMLLIDRQLGDPSPFAETGDSGATVCLSDEDDATTLHVLGLLNGGDLKLNGSDSLFCTCFLLQAAFEKLHLQTDIRLEFLSNM